MEDDHGQLIPGVMRQSERFQWCRYVLIGWVASVFLTSGEIDALLERREKLVQQFKALLEQYGENILVSF